MSNMIPTLPSGGAGSIPVLGDGSGLDAPLLNPTPLAKPKKTSSFTQLGFPDPSLKVQTYTQAHDILDRVHNRKMSWQDAQQILKDLPSGVRDQLHREYAIRPDSFRYMDELKALSSPGSKKGSVVGNLISDVGTTVKGLPAGMVKTADALATDVRATAAHPLRNSSLWNYATGGEQPKSAFMQEIVDPTLKNYKETYGPAFHGDLGETAHRIGEHPLSPILDALAVASAGVGTVGRVSAASEALAATRITTDTADKFRMGVTADKPAGRFIIAKGKGDSPLWTVRDTKGKIIAGGMPSKDAAVAHAQSLVTGGVLAPVLETEWRQFTNPKYVAAQDELAQINARLIEVQRETDRAYYAEADANLAHRSAPHPASEMGSLAFYQSQGFQRDMARLREESIQLLDRKRQLEAGLGGTAFKPKNNISPTIRQNVVTNPADPKSRLAIASDAFLSKPQGSLIDAYERARGISHAEEIEGIITESIVNVLDNPELRLTRPQLKEVASQIAQDLVMTYQKDKGRVSGLSAENPAFISPGVSATLQSLGITAREVSDLVRAGAVFLRPAYIPNNWAGNSFLNVIQQGVFAPVNLAKSLTMDKHLGTRYTRLMDQMMGFNAAEIVYPGGRGSGYVSSLMNPVAHTMGQIADQPFRRAAFLHELRRAGYKKMSDVQRLLEKADREAANYGTGFPVGKGLEDRAQTTPALFELGKAARAAQEEIVKFGHYNDMERNLLRNLIFVYSWMRGAGRYFGRFPFQHPIQAAAYAQLGNIGSQWLTEEMGGVPFYLIGAIPVGRDDKGNPILINPFSVNPLGTGASLLAAGASAKQIITDPSSFNKYAQEDPAELLNPVLRSGLEAYTGGRPMKESLTGSVAALRLKENLKHPGRGQVYPTTRREAVGQFVFGSLFPRQADQAAITRSLERESADQPLERLDTEKAEIEKRTGEKLPADFVAGYKADLKELSRIKDYQHKYAQDHGSQGFRNLPPQNQAEAALAYLRRYRLIAPDDFAEVEDELKRAHTDAEFTAYANHLWASTGAGKYKDKWQELLHGTRDSQNLTKKRP